MSCVQHTKGETSGVNVWKKPPQLPSPAGWGWTKHRKSQSFNEVDLDSEQGLEKKPWLPVWTTIPEAAASCYELIHCDCKKKVCRNCKCAKANLKCTALCKCAGECRDIQME